MRPRSVVAFIALLISAGTSAAQTKSTDSQTLESILEEVRQLRQDLRTVTEAAKKAQILVYRVQMQEGVVRRWQDRVDDTRSKITQIQHEEKRLMTNARQMAESQDRDDNSKGKEEIEPVLAHIKSELETQSNLEQEAQAKLLETEEQLRIEGAKLSALQSELDQLDKKLQ